MAQLPNRDKEAARGRQMALDIERRTTAIDNSQVQDYVKRLGGRPGGGDAGSEVS